VTDDETPELLWRWEVKSLAALGTLKAAAQAQRAWRKQVRGGGGWESGPISA